MKVWKKITAALLCFVLIGAGTATVAVAATNNDVTKDESVYLILNPDGSVNKQIVSCWVHADAGLGKITDISTLGDITNVKSDVQPSIDGDEVKWNTTDTDVYYNGTTNKKPPVSAKITYTLDGKMISAQDLMGKSGDLTINIKLTNNEKETKMIDGESRTIYTPFAAALVIDMPNDIFTQVDAGDSQIFTDSKHQIVSYLSLPGLAETFDGVLEDTLEDFDENLADEFQISAEVTGFEMPSIIIASATDLTELENININDDLTSISEGIDELENATTQLQDGIDLLADALRDYDSAMGELETGNDQFNDAVFSVAAGSAELMSGADQLKTASALLRSSVENEMIPGLAASAGVQQQLTEKMAALELQLAFVSTPDMAALSAQLNASISNVCDASSDATILVLTGAGFGSLAPEQQAAITAARTQIKEQASAELAAVMATLDMSALENLETSLTEIRALSDQLMGSMAQLTSSLYDPNDDPSNPQTMANAIIALAIGAEDLYNGSAEMNAGVHELSGASNELAASVAALKEASNEIADKSGDLDDGMGEYVNEGLSEIFESDVIDELMTASAIKDEMQAQADEYNTYCGAPEGAETSLKFIMKLTEVEASEAQTEESTEEPVADADTVAAAPTIWQRIGNFFLNLL